MRYVILAALAAILGTAASAHAKQFVVNGDFTELSKGVGELGTNTQATGWDANGGYTFAMTDGTVGSTGTFGNVSLWTASNGGANRWNGLTASGVGNFAALDGESSPAPLTQTIMGLTVGETYTLSFRYAFAQQTGFMGNTKQSVTASLGGSDIIQILVNPQSKGFFGWGTFTDKITADATSETLSFLAAGSPAAPPFTLLSEISLTGGVPEASTWAMMLIGFGGVAFAAFRSRRRVAATA
jgi:PEP-CTERM motif